MIDKFDSHYARLKGNQIFRIFAQGITEHPSLYLGQQSMLLPLTFGLQAVFLLNYYLDRYLVGFLMQYVLKF